MSFYLGSAMNGLFGGLQDTLGAYRTMAQNTAFDEDRQASKDLADSVINANKTPANTTPAGWTDTTNQGNPGGPGTSAGPMDSHNPPPIDVTKVSQMPRNMAATQRPESEATGNAAGGALQAAAPSPSPTAAPTWPVEDYSDIATPAPPKPFAGNALHPSQPTAQPPRQLAAPRVLSPLNSGVPARPALRPVGIPSLAPAQAGLGQGAPLNQALAGGQSMPLGQFLINAGSNREGTGWRLRGGGVMPLGTANQFP